MSIAFALLCRYAMPGISEIPGITFFISLLALDCLFIWQAVN